MMGKGSWPPMEASSRGVEVAEGLTGSSPPSVIKAWRAAPYILTLTLVF